MIDKETRVSVFPETPIAPVLVVYPLTGAQRFLFASDEYDGYDT